MVVKDTDIPYPTPIYFNDTMYSVSETMDSTATQLENLTSANSLHNRHSPNLDGKSTGYYSTTPSPGSFQRSNSQSSLSGTMSPQDYSDLRSPTRQEASFFTHTSLFDPTSVAHSVTNTYPTPSFGIFGAPTNLQPVGNNGIIPMMNTGLDIKPSLEIKTNMQPHPFYTHEVMPPIHGQLPSPNSHRTGMGQLGIPSIPPFAGYRPYPQVNDLFTPTKQEFYMQSPFYPGYPNYW